MRDLKHRIARIHPTPVPETCALNAMLRVAVIKDSTCCEAMDGQFDNERQTGVIDIMKTILPITR